MSIGAFFKDCAADLRRIASATRGDMSIDDVRQEAWLVAADIERKRGYPVDFGETGDQVVVLKWLHDRLVKFAEKQFRYAQRIDRGWDDAESDSAATTIARLLRAPLHSDPFVALQSEEEVVDYMDLVRHSYSEPPHTYCYSSDSTGTYTISPTSCE